MIQLLSEVEVGPWELSESASTLIYIIPALAILVYSLYRKERELKSNARRNFLIALRLVALIILAILYFEPHKTIITTEDLKSPFLIFVDKSLSMSRKADELSSKEALLVKEKFGAGFVKMSRFEQQKACVLELQKALKNSHAVKVVGYGESFAYLNDVVSWDGTQLDNQTRLNEAMRLAVSETRGESISGMAVFGDGNIEDIDSVLRFIEKIREQSYKDMKVKAVGFGSSVIKPDVKLLSFSVPEVVMKSKDEVTLRASFSARGVKAEEAIKFKLFENGVELKSQAKQVSLKEGMVEFDVVMNQSGKFTYRLELEALKDEIMVENNVRSSFVMVKDEKLKILYIENYPRHDYRKITQFFERNRSLYESRIWLMQSTLKYKQRGSEALKQSPAVTYTDFDKLWKEADVIFLGNVDEKAFSGSYFLEHLEKFVKKGGGLVFLAGPQFNPASYEMNEHVTKLLPILLPKGSRKDGMSHKVPYSYQLSQRGARHPVIRMGLPEVTKSAWEVGLPLAQWFYRPAGVKPSTVVLIEHPSEKLSVEKDVNVPVFATMPYGKGQTFWLGVDEMSRWSYLDNDEYMFSHFMGQLVQFMSSNKVRAGGLIEVDSDQIPLGDEVTVTLRLEDAHESSVMKKKVHWSYDNEEAQSLDLIRRSAGSAVFEGKLIPKKKGIVNVWLKSKANAQQVAVTGFSRELENNELNVVNLNKLSDEGKMLPLASISMMAADFISNQETKERLSRDSLLDSQRGSDGFKVKVIWILLILLSMVLGVEWWLRKRWHLL